MDSNQLCIMSYNSRGFSDEKKMFCNNIVDCGVNKIPILCNQENFLLDCNKHIIEKTLSNLDITFKPAVKNSLDGRPKGGLFIAVPIYLKNCVKDVSPMNNWRVQAITLQCGTMKILIINVYFPCDPRTLNFDSNSLNVILATITELIDNVSFDQFVICGDLNCDFRRNTGHVNTINMFINDNMLMKAWDFHFVDFTYTHEYDNIISLSVIDHFLWNSNFGNSVLECGVIHNVDNTSDHELIYCICSIGNFEILDIDNCDHKEPIPLWKKASITDKINYKSSLLNNLNNIIPPNCAFTCSNVHCSDVSHKNNIDNYLLEILYAIDKSCIDTLPLSKNISFDVNKKNRNHLPLWNELVKPHRDTASFWYAIWLSAGKPINCNIHNIMKRTRNIFHQHVRKAKKIKNEILRNNFTNACLNKELDLFSEIKKHRHSGNSPVLKIDGIVNDTEIANHFAGIYKSIYNEYSENNELIHVQNNLESKINNSSIFEIEKITPKLIEKSFQYIKNGKYDPVFKFSSDCLKNAPNSLFQHLCTIIKSFLYHGHISSFLVLSTIIPLIKNKLGNKEDSSNYRSISICSVFMKMFDWILILLYGHKLELDVLQFSYQANCSANMATWLAIESINYFNNNGSNVYACVMDMTKAFDKVKHSTLFNKLIDAKIPPIFLRFLLITYRNQVANVKWNSKFSCLFTLSNGVKQGAIISGILYCFYVNSLYKTLRNRKSGCWIQFDFVGIIGYADDILLLAPDLDALQEMISTCESFANSHGMSFSTNEVPHKSKTKCIAFLKYNTDLRNMKLNGKILPWVDTFKHLGTTVNNKLCGMKQDLSMKRATFINRNNNLMQEFYFAHPHTLFEINKIYNFDFTSSVLWDLFSPDAIKLEKTWNISCRRMFRLPRQTHKYLIEPITCQPHLKIVLIKRFLNFCERLNSSKKDILHRMFDRIKYNVRSITGSNLRNIKSCVNKTTIEDLTPLDANYISYHKIETSEIWRVNVINEIMQYKYNNLTIENLQPYDIQFLMNFACTS